MPKTAAAPQIREDRLAARQARCDVANELIRTIASCGRRFFRHGDRVAHMSIGDHGQVWFHDHYNEWMIFANRNGQWRGFTSGGTLRGLVEALRDYINDGTRLARWRLDGTGANWGYGDDMQKVCAAADALGVIEPKEKSPDA